MHVLITGGAGFIGCNVAAGYLKAGAQVTVLDNLSRPGSQFNIPWLKTLAAEDQLRFVRGDVRSADLVDRAVRDSQADVIFHFAAQTAVTTSLDNPREDLEVNLLGTFNVLEAVRRFCRDNPPAIFLTSTNKVYGALSQRGVVQTASRYRFADEALDRLGVDESEPLDFHSPYGCSKGAADQYMRDYHRIYDLPTVVFRMSCIYGPRQFGTEDQGWVAHFFLTGAQRQPIAIYGNGKQVRDILFVDDLVAAFQAAARNIRVTAGQVYNIGGGPANALSVWAELKPRLEHIAGLNLRETMHAWRPGDQPVYVSNTAAAARDFGWHPRVGLDEGLARLWAWVQQHPLLGRQLTDPRPIRLVEPIQAPAEAVVARPRK
jgi:CDP-paratose 2-epimerase